MKRIAYIIGSPSHKRVFESFKDNKDIEQFIIGPRRKASGGIIHEDYSGFSIKNILEYTSKSEINGIIKKINPAICAQSDLEHYNYAKAKRIFISHGMVGNHVIDLVKKKQISIEGWKNFDLYCGATAAFAQWVNYVAGSQQILLNAIPQFDIIKNSNILGQYQNKILGQEFGRKKSILFLGFCCKDRLDFVQHSEDFFKTAIALAELAEHKNLAVFIKPRQEFSRLLSFLKANNWGNKYINDFVKLKINPNVRFLGPADNHIYYYYFADLFVVNGCSTSEVEAICLKKPLIVVRTKQNIKNGYDPFDSVLHSAALEVASIGDLETSVNSFDAANHLEHNQINFLNKRGIMFDGLMSKRIQDRLAVL